MVRRHFKACAAPRPGILQQKNGHCRPREQGAVGADSGPGGLLDAQARGGRWPGRWRQCTKTSHLRSLAVMARVSEQEAERVRRLL